MKFGWTRFTNQILASWKRCLSFRKNDWVLSDYPVCVRAQEFSPDNKAPSRFKAHRYTAYVVNWTLSGGGDTRHEAKADLAINFEAAKVERQRQGKRVPRPGVSEPIQFASQERVGAHPELADDFIRRVLQLEWAWISDESSLWDFHTDEDNRVLLDRINEVYGVDVSDIESAKLFMILDRIAAKCSS